MARRHTTVYGVGINDANYRVVENTTIGYTSEGKQIQQKVWQCPIYSCWKDMIRRTTSEDRVIWYEDCGVASEWLRFSNFRSWALPRFCEGLQLDKDIIIKANNTYSEQTCEFVPTYLNNIFRVVRKGLDLPIGVTLKCNKGCKPFYRASISINNRHKHIGHFDNPLLAHWAWLEHKVGAVEDLLKRYSQEDYCKPIVFDAVSSRLLDIKKSLVDKERVFIL